GSRQQIEEILSRKPRHWLGYFDGSFENREGGAIDLVPARLTHDQIREVNARTHVMNELVDEALGRVLKRIAERGWAGDTDVIYTTDHGELQGDFGLLFKGPFHTDALMHIPLVWRPAPRLGLRPAEIVEPVGQLDLAPTFCEIAGVPVPGFVEGEPLPTAPGSPREQVLCEWDSQFPGFGMHMRSIRRDRYLCTAYEPSTVGRPTGLEERFGEWALRSCGVEYGGDEGELYDVVEDPLQWRNLWDEPACRSLRDDLVQAIREGLPAGRAEPLKVESPA
ncbi:MAG: sulfatase-like hydrolase/transferase, partial [Acidimicrobiales bacterium]